jgi:hypothetical protein
MYSLFFKKDIIKRKKALFILKKIWIILIILYSNFSFSVIFSKSYKEERQEAKKGNN